MAAKNEIAEALKAMRQAPRRGLGRKSAIYQWMEARHAALAAAFEKEPPSWTGLAKYFAGIGLMDTNGRPPTAAATRSAWLRVDATMRRQRQGAPDLRSKAPPSPVLAKDDDPSGDTPLPDDFEFTPIQGKR